MIFLSHAAKFNLRAAWRHLWIRGRDSDRHRLIRHLEKRYAGTAVLYYNCRSALAAALGASIPAGSSVAVNGLTCFAVPQSIKSAGHTPRYLDVTSSDLNFDLAALKHAIATTPDLKAIIIQNMLGLTIDIAPIEHLARHHQLVIIEDLAHCVGASYPDGREVGTVGDYVVMSFGKGKVIDTTHGGALICRNPKLVQVYREETSQTPRLADRFRDRIYPLLGVIVRKFWRVKLGPAIVVAALKLRLITKSADGDIAPGTTMADWQARLALEQLRRLQRDGTIRRGYAANLASDLDMRGVPADLLRPGSVPIRLPILVHDRTALLRRLSRVGYYLDDVWYDVPVSPKRHYRSVKFPEDDCPTATTIASQLINLPTDVPLDYLAGAIHIIKRWQLEHGDV